MVKLFFRTHLLVLGLIIPASLFFNCGMQELSSKWRDREIAIDGIDNGTEWENARNYLDEQKVTVGLMNDEKNLYVRLSTRDRTLQRQLAGLGFTVWFDESGGGKKKLGIHFPIGMQGMRNQQMPEGNLPPREGENNKEQPLPENGAPGERPTRSGGAGQMDMMLAAVQNQLEMIGPGKNQRETLTAVEAQKIGILCRIGDTNGNLVYELQYPLYRNEESPYGIMRTGQNYPDCLRNRENGPEPDGKPRRKRRHGWGTTGWRRNGWRYGGYGGYGWKGRHGRNGRGAERRWRHGIRRKPSGTTVTRPVAPGTPGRCGSLIRKRGYGFSPKPDILKYVK
jgi:hypothetical protein